MEWKLNSKLQAEGEVLEVVVWMKRITHDWSEKCRGKSFPSIARSIKICFLFRKIVFIPCDCLILHPAGFYCSSAESRKLFCVKIKC